MHEVFVLLTGCTSLDIAIDPDPLQGPEVIVLDLPYCFVTAWVSCAPVIVVLQGKKMAPCEHPWSTIVNIASYPHDKGSPVIKSITITGLPLSWGYDAILTIVDYG